MMRIVIAGALLAFGAGGAASAADLYRDGSAYIEERVVADPDVVIHHRTRRVVVTPDCIPCRGGGLPWGGLRKPYVVGLPWGGLPEYCPSVQPRRRAVLVRKG